MCAVTWLSVSSSSGSVYYIMIPFIRAAASRHNMRSFTERTTSMTFSKRNLLRNIQNFLIEFLRQGV